MLSGLRNALRFKVLVVEDNDDLRELISENLRELGHEPVPARDRATALRTFDEQPIDVLLTDVALPDGSGIKLACAISQRFPRVPIIVSSGYGSAFGGDRVESAIGRDVLTLPKPFDIDQLKTALDQAGAQLAR
jgi:DNA-binding NtrC family response regulator